MIAFKIAISDAQVAAYKDKNPGEIDVTAKELVIHCDVNDVTTVNTRTGTVINKLSGTPIANKRDVKYDFVAAEWEFTAYISIDILTLLSALESQHSTGIPIKNYLDGKSTSTPYTSMDIKILTAEKKGATVNCNGSYRPFGGVTLRIARVDLPV